MNAYKFGEINDNIELNENNSIDISLKKQLKVEPQRNKSARRSLKNEENIQKFEKVTESSKKKV